MATEAARRFLVAINRFGLGATPRSLGLIAPDPAGAILAEIDAAIAGATPQGSAERMSALIGEQMAFQKAENEARAAARKQQALAEMAAPPASPGAGMMAAPMAGDGMMAAPAAPPAAPIASQTPAVLPNRPPPPAAVHYNAETEKFFADLLAAEVGFAQRWMMFWSNHFCIDVTKSQITRVAAGLHERDLIAGRMFGRFEDLLIAVETSPPMLAYLDQQGSVGPNSPAGKRRSRGLNENLAREILELHTMGVQGGYTQADVTNFAKVITGYTFAGIEARTETPGAFFFNANAHEPGPQVVLGKTFEQPNMEQGLAVLRMLAAHPKTAEFLAYKIARHFVADEPPGEIVRLLAETYQKTNGDLGALARALVTAKGAWDAPMTKLRTPREFVAAAMRASAGGDVANPPLGAPQFQFFLRMMGQPLWNPISPNGFPDTEDSLAAPEAIRTRLDVAMQIARRRGGGLNPSDRAELLLGPALSEDSRQAIARAESKPQGFAILLLTPEFQRR